MISVMGEDAARDFHINIDHVVISIKSPGFRHVRLPKNVYRKARLKLKFHDIDREYPGLTEIFSPAHARRILRFFKKHGGRHFLIHCEAGISRSPAVAAALTKAAGVDDSDYFKRYIPNRLVYRTILEETAPLKGRGE